MSIADPQSLYLEPEREPGVEPSAGPSGRRASATAWTRLLLRRCLWGLLVLFVIATVTFFLSHYVPSDPAVYLAGENATTEQVAKVRHEFGLDKPAYVQFARYLENIAKGDLGTSIFTRRPVFNDIVRTLPVTLGLVVPAFAVYVVVAMVLGFFSAYRRRRARSALIGFGTMTLSAAPVYWVALVLQFVFFYRLGLFPAGGQHAPTSEGPGTITGIDWLDSLLHLDFSAFVDALWHLCLPLTVIVIGLIAVGTRLVAGTVGEELDKHYVRAARGRGLTERRIALKHILRAVVNPFVTVTGIQFGYLITYSILVEVVFTWPGMGYYLEQSIQVNDYAPLIAVTLVASAGFVIISILSDIIYHLTDPRIPFN
jgi:peptide/nickel transport system permease protein